MFLLSIPTAQQTVLHEPKHSTIKMAQDLRYSVSVHRAKASLLNIQGLTGGANICSFISANWGTTSEHNFLRISDTTFLAQIPFTSHSSVT